MTLTKKIQALVVLAISTGEQADQYLYEASAERFGATREQYDDAVDELVDAGTVRASLVQWDKGYAATLCTTGEIVHVQLPDRPARTRKAKRA